MYVPCPPPASPPRAHSFATPHRGPSTPSSAGCIPTCWRACSCTIVAARSTRESCGGTCGTGVHAAPAAAASVALRHPPPDSAAAAHLLLLKLRCPLPDCPFLPPLPPSPLLARAHHHDGRAARKAALEPGGPLTLRFLARQPVVLQVGGSVFVHGGLLPEHVDHGLDRLNAETQVDGRMCGVCKCEGRGKGRRPCQVAASLEPASPGPHATPEQHH